MVYRHKQGRAFLFQALRPDTGYEQLGTGATDREVAKEVARMWAKLARKRAWDLLNPILSAKGRARTRLLLQLFDLWETARGEPETIRQLLKDRNIEPIVAEWSVWYQKQVAPDSAAHALTHVRWLLPPGEPRLVSETTTTWLTQRLTAYPGKRNTSRKVHSNWSNFFGYLTVVHQLWPANPMDAVPRPSTEESPIRFYELDEAERIVGWQPTEQRRALFALFYGSGIEASIPMRLRRRDFDAVAKTVRAAGTKTSTRDRVSRIADWAWPTVWGYVKDSLPDAQPWTGVSRFTASDWHRETVGKNGLNLPHQHPLHCARDHWAVRYLRSGGSVQVVASQLGHRDPNLTLRKYGRFRPDQVDRDRMEQQAQDYDAKRRENSEASGEMTSGDTSMEQAK
jgi:integrase